MRHLIATILLLYAVAGSAAVNVADDCTDCHDAAPVSASHEPVASLSVQMCLDCHAAKPGDPFVRAVHQSHLDQGFECVDCHTSGAPERAQLDALLEHSIP